jgi:hypothetical protein
MVVSIAFEMHGSEKRVSSYRSVKIQHPAAALGYGAQVKYAT